MRRLVSIESLPYTCDVIVEAVADILRRQTSMTCVAVVHIRRSMSVTTGPRPAPAPTDVYHELSAILHRLRSVRDAAARYPLADVCVVDGWIPAAPSPHPLVARLTSQLAARALQDANFEVHDALLLDGSPHVSFEGGLEYGADAEFAPGLRTFASVVETRARFHVAFQQQRLSPVRCGRLLKIDVDPNADQNPVDVYRIARATVSALFPLVLPP